MQVQIPESTMKETVCRKRKEGRTAEMEVPNM